MSEAYIKLKTDLNERPRKWLVTGAAGFIGSHLTETLLTLNQDVVALDNFSTGFQHNVDDLLRAVNGRGRLTFLEGDIRDSHSSAEAVRGCDYVLHQAALGSVPRSLEDPLTSHGANVTGFVVLLDAARKAGVKRFIYASSSSIYGDSNDGSSPNIESRTGRALSPYAATKQIDEIYAGAFERSYSLQTVGLRYFNVFGPRQDPNGAYAAVIPRWIAQMIEGESCVINGDGETSRDFCFVENVVQANLLAAASYEKSGVFNIAVGETTSLNELHAMLARGVKANIGRDVNAPKYGVFRAGDIRFSQADISLAKNELGYQPAVRVGEGLEKTVGWYCKRKA